MSPFHDREAISAIRLSTYNLFLLTILTAISGILSSLLAAAEAGPHSASQLVGGLFYWTALALLSSKLFGPQLAWVLPLVIHLPVTWWGFGDRPGTAAWWAVPAQNDGWSTTVSGAVFLVAVMAFSMLTRHHLRGFR
jgi:hypothetical protein